MVDGAASGTSASEPRATARSIAGSDSARKVLPGALARNGNGPLTLYVFMWPLSGCWVASAVDLDDKLGAELGGVVGLREEPVA